MKRVFMELTRRLNLPRHRVGGLRAEKNIPQQGRAVLVSWHSTFSNQLRNQSDLKGIHLIRDPRDVLISGARYHLTVPAWREGWLYKPTRKFDGNIYHSLSYKCRLRVPELDRFLAAARVGIINAVVMLIADRPTIIECGKLF